MNNVNNVHLICTLLQVLQHYWHMRIMFNILMLAILQEWPTAPAVLVMYKKVVLYSSV